MKYICPGCNEEFEISKASLIMCPYCDIPIIKESEYKKIKDTLQNNKYTEDDLEDILKTESKVYEKIKGTPLEKVTEYIEAMYKLLKDPTAQWKSKVVALASLIYVFNPADIIPDIIPALGLVDDAGAIMIAVGVLGKAIEKYMTELNNKKGKSDKTVIYKLKGQTSTDETTGIQKKNLFIWNIPSRKRNDIYAQLITGKMINGNEVYVLNRNVGEHLVPANDFDQYITDSIFNEATMIFKALGVEKITCTRKIATATNKKIASKAEFKTIFDGENYTNIKDVKVQEDKIESVFEKVDLSESLKNTDFIDKLIWYFTDNSIISDTIFNERFILGLKRTNINRSLELNSVLDVDSRANIKKYCEGMSTINISECAKIQWNIDVEYHSLSDIDSQHLKSIYEDIKRKINIRREEIEQF
ncbi:DUF1232 domain-containing protein [Terrisporobacter vanillatitrophus]|uniref:DUF1232 domain-containing protein n=1 Tax=Terrisporobacter vanillatitrophus TaxID=3058402 RepID=UPI0033675AD7